MATDNPDLVWAKSCFGDSRQGWYQRAHAYVDGDQPLAFATTKFRSAFGDVFRAFAYNRCSMVVDAHADRMQVVGFTADDESVASAAQTLWEDNQMSVREGQLYQEMFTCGDGPLLVDVNPDTGAVQMWPQHAALVRFRYSETSPGQREVGVKQWTDPAAKASYLNIYYPGRIEKYRGNAAGGGTPNWQPYQPEGEQWPVMLGVDDTVPIFHFANNARISGYGRSELQDVFPLQDAINKTLMDMLVTMEFAAFPQRVLINVDTDDDDTAEAIRKFHLGVDRLIALVGVDGGQQPSIAEFTAANITQYTTVANLFDTMISRVSKVPVHYLQASSNFTSGRALRIAESPFVAKIEDRQRAAGAVWSEVMRYGLRLQGMDVAPGDIKIVWKSATPMSQDDQLDIAVQESAIGLPLVTILKGMGYDKEQIEDVQEEKMKALAGGLDISGSSDNLDTLDGEAA